MDRSLLPRSPFLGTQNTPQPLAYKNTPEMVSIPVGDHALTFVSNFVRGKSGSRQVGKTSVEQFEYI
jgi:hypothetical protein